jgi:hypothetical protein
MWVKELYYETMVYNVPVTDLTGRKSAMVYRIYPLWQLCLIGVECRNVEVADVAVA